MAPGRAARPGALPARSAAAAEDACPFCAGHERETPPELLALGRAGGDADTPGWTVRVVPNKFPALPGQEVVVHGPAHATSLAAVEPAVVAAAVEAWGRRARAHAKGGAAYLLCAVNEGARAGASLRHSHSQLVPFAALPPRVEAELAALGDDCRLCAALERERPRALRDEDGLRSFCPSWGGFPYELWIAPVEHLADAFAFPPAALAAALLDAAGRLQELLGQDLSWNAWLHSAPLAGGGFHWHLELAPRLTVLAAVELGAGVAVNIVDPDRAAEELREARR